MSYEDIIVERVEGWVEITINRPEKLNSLRERTAEEILGVLAEAENDRAIGAVILKGSTKAFCTGIDTSEFQIAENEYFDFYRKRKRQRRVNQLFRDLPSFSKPVITAVEGFALGGGLELAMVGDMIVAGADAKLGLPETRLGLMPGGGGTQTLPRLIGKALAKELIWTGRRISAAEAREYRLVNHVTDQDVTVITLDPDYLQEHLRSNIPFEIVLPAVNNLSLIGGRPVSLGTHPVLYTRWASGSGRCSLYQFRSSDFNLPEQTEKEVVSNSRVNCPDARDKNCNVVIWTESGRGYALVADNQNAQNCVSSNGDKP